MDYTNIASSGARYPGAFKPLMAVRKQQYRARDDKQERPCGNNEFHSRNLGHNISNLGESKEPFELKWIDSN